MFHLRPIGVIKTNASDEEVKSSLEGVDGVVEIYEEYSEGLDGIEHYSHIVIIAYLHKVPNGKFELKIKPRGPLKRGYRLEDLPLVGVFATCSPRRPNPIAVTVVKLVKKQGRFLYVKGLDLFNGTPVLDIKPYNRSMHIDQFKVPIWSK